MRASNGPPGLRGFSRWVLACLAVVLAVASVTIAAPFAVQPADIPAPVVDHRTLTAKVEAEHARGDALGVALATELARGEGDRHFDLRALGEAVRAFGRAEATHDTIALGKARKSVLDALGRARSLGDDTLVAFRGFQTTLFLRELHQWERTSLASADLLELGGSFLEVAARYGWIDERHRLQMDEATRSVFFRLRWNELTGLGSPAFALSVAEQRALYRFLLVGDEQSAEATAGARDGTATRRRAAEWKLRKIDELSRLDSAYPASLARGVVLFSLGRPAAAAEAFREHLARFPDGPYTLRARNYLLAAVARAAAESL